MSRPIGEPYQRSHPVEFLHPDGLLLHTGERMVLQINNESVGGGVFRGFIWRDDAIKAPDHRRGAFPGWVLLFDGGIEIPVMFGGYRWTFAIIEPRPPEVSLTKPGAGE